MLDISNQIPHTPVKYFFNESTVPQDYDGPAHFESLQSWKDYCKSGRQTDRSPDYAFCYYWATEKGLLLWPVSGFSDYGNLGVPLEERQLTELVRVSLTRDDEYISNLKDWASGATKSN